VTRCFYLHLPCSAWVEDVNGRSTHCGVLEFLAEEGVVYMPHWMMQNLLLQVGDMVRFTNVSLPKGKFVKLQPVTSDFLDITNPKAVLERTLRSYTCLTTGDVFPVNYNNKIFEFEVMETRPGAAISVVETDCEVDFAPPKDYKEPQRVPQKSAAEPMDEDAKASTSKAGAAAPGAAEEQPAQPTFLAFAGSGRRLDGKAATPSQPVPVPKPGAPPVAPSTSSPGTSAGQKPGTFVSTGNRLQDKLLQEKAAKGQSPAAKQQEPEQKEEAPSFQPFKGKAFSLKG